MEPGQPALQVNSLPGSPGSVLTPSKQPLCPGWLPPCGLTHRLPVLCGKERSLRLCGSPGHVLLQDCRSAFLRTPRWSRHKGCFHQATVTCGTTVTPWGEGCCVGLRSGHDPQERRPVYFLSTPSGSARRAGDRAEELPHGGTTRVSHESWHVPQTSSPVLRCQGWNTNPTTWAADWNRRDSGIRPCPRGRGVASIPCRPLSP